MMMMTVKRTVQLVKKCEREREREMRVVLGG